MRGIILILILVVVLAIAAFATGLLNLTPTQPGQVPSVAAQDGKLRVQGGQLPKAKVEAGQIAVGQGEATVRVPRIEVRPAGNQPAVPTDNAVSSSNTVQQ
ncbi:hypothetical protein M8312_09395 [Sphingomonas sp. KRR8]|uniref:hypothetical protein n=1 Tax=Sphingomonas sp. KRR8 TaxID=2942996 RepID=UPI002021A039|nr:hypothetical protein [Sphingomonas sp. KRR8]URD60014.1 hypothetical protein M8312_09395 [Sphingomonas sp. KRR8]